MSIKRSNADAAFSEAIRLNKRHTCEHCGRQGRTECAHLVGRRDKALRWDALNAVCLDHSCHRYFTENPKAFVDWVDRTWPGRWEILHEKRRFILKDNKKTRDEVAAHYREQVKRITADPNHKLESWI